MELGPYVDRLRNELLVAAEAGGKDARALADRLTAPLDSATRLILLEAMAAASDEITRDLAPGSVEVRLRGQNPSFVVTLPPTEEAFADTTTSRPPAPAIRTEGDEGGTSRDHPPPPRSPQARSGGGGGGGGPLRHRWARRGGGRRPGAGGSRLATEQPARPPELPRRGALAMPTFETLEPISVTIALVV